jgi:hypothetical protein
MSEPFHPDRSSLTADQLTTYLQSPIGESLTSGVKIGVGPATVEAFREHNVTTGYQLIAKFLSFRDPNMDTRLHVEMFYQWLKEVMPASGYRAGLVHAIAEKCNLMFPELGYDRHLYD